MILQELAAYYDRRTQDPDPSRHLPLFGLERKAIPFIVELTEAGDVVQLIDTRQGEGKKLKAKNFLVPLGVKRAAGIVANLLWDTATYALGIASKGEFDARRFEAFKMRLEDISKRIGPEVGLDAVIRAVNKADWQTLIQSPAWVEILDSNPVISFQLMGDCGLVCERPLIQSAAIAGTAQGQIEGRCLVEGNIQPIQTLHASIKQVWGAQTSGANIVSFNNPAFESYGKRDRKGENAPVGVQAAFKYTTALNHLLADGSRNRFQVGDSSTVVWSDSSNRYIAEDFLADLFGMHKDDPDRQVNAVKTLYQSVQTGVIGQADDDPTFCVLGLAPNAARIAIRFWLKEPFSILAPRLREHFDDLKLARQFDSDPVHPPMFRLLTALAVQDKADNIPPRLAGEWMRSILEGRPYPATVLNACVNRCKATREINYLRAATLKACLNRQIRSRSGAALSEAPSRLFQESLDMQQPDVAYRMGRLFAVLERLQERAQPGINATIRDRFYAAASCTPVAVFTTLLRLKNAHLKKLDAPLASYFERLIGDILVDVAEIPRQLALPDQARFALGYYHQRHEMFQRKSDNATANNTSEAA